MSVTWLPRPALQRATRFFSPRPDRRRACRALLLVLALVVGLPAHAKEARDESEQWVPAFGMYFDVLRHKARGSVQTSEILGPPFPAGCLLSPFPGFPRMPTGALCPRSLPPFNSGALLAPTDQGSDTNVTTMVGGNLELMSPRLTERFLMPRFFAHLDLAASFGFERNLAGTGTPGAFARPIPSQNSADIFEVAVFGQGSRTRTQVERLVWSAGTGIAFTVDAFQRRIRIKPSFEWIREDIEVSGVVNRAVQLAQDTTNFGDIRPVSLSAKRKVRYHGFGPGLELEADAVRTGPVIMSVFALGRAYHFSGSLTETLFASNQFGEFAQWQIEHERWAYRAGVGIRFRWVGE